MSGSDILGHLHNIKRVEVDEINTIFDRDSIKIARDKLKEEGYSVLEEGRYEKASTMNTNKVLPKQNISDFKVEEKSDKILTYSFSMHNESGSSDTVKIRYVDYYKKRSSNNSFPQYYNNPTKLGLKLLYSRRSGNPDYVVFMEK
jgi:hypothetical protein